jgi:acyl carrier protein
MSAAEIRDVIVKALEESLAISGNSNIAPRMNDPSADIRFDELEFDSLSGTEIALNIEYGTGYVCDLGDFLAYPSVNALTDHIAAQAPSAAHG